MAELIYVLCALTSFACAWLLLHRYRISGHRLVFWSGLCFVGMTVNNLMLVFDKLIFPEMNLLPLRHLGGLIGVMMLLYGLIYEKE